MSNFKTILVVLAVLLLACYMSIEYARDSEKSTSSALSLSSSSSVSSKEGKSYKTHEEEGQNDENIPRVIQDMCYNVPIVDGEDCYKQLYPITLPYVDYKSDHIPPAFANSPCIV
jgi:hypothetical protein